MLGIRLSIAARGRLVRAARFALLWSCACVALGAFVLRADEVDEDEDDVGLPGLSVVYSRGGDDASGQELLITKTIGRLALALDAKNSPDPALAADRFRAVFDGRLFVQRPGSYAFRVEASGRFTLKIGEQVVFDNVAGQGDETSITAQAVTLKYGQNPLTATYEKTSSEQPARLRLFWRREGEAEFAVPAAVFSRAKPTATKLKATPLGAEAGRALVADLRCAACHDVGSLNFAESEIATERAPKLVGIGDRVNPDWLHRWLAAPKLVRRQATMPDLFGETPEELTDLYAATKYLTTLKGKAKPASATAAATVRRAGIHTPDQDLLVRKAMASTGCIACHLLPGEDTAKFPELRSLDRLGDKMTAAVIKERIADPRKHYPGSRMPDFRLAKEQPKLLDEIAEYLAAQKSPTPQPTPEAPSDELLAARWNANFTAKKDRERFAALPDDEKWSQLGARVVEVRGCLNCHDLDKRKTKAAPPALVKADAARLERGCLSATPQAPAAEYRFDDAQRGAVRAALATYVDRKRVNAPLFAAERQLDRSGCTKCHAQGGRESSFASRILSFVPLGTDQTIHDLAPPSLAGIGEKLTVKAMQGVIDGKTRARPWMALQMPHFAPEHVKGLGTSLAAMDGIDPRLDSAAGLAKEETQDGAAPSPPPSPQGESGQTEQLEIGRQLVGRTGLNCVSCHDIRGIASIGVRGPDLAKVPDRVREEWFRAWLTDPQRFTPGTRMPTVFFGGKSAAPQFLDGDPERQIDALWAYLSQGSKMELPSLAPPANAIVPGGENPLFTPSDKPMIVRGFMPGTGGLRGIALGTPEKLHYAFDSERCTLAAAWEGDFAEVGGWYDNGRGTPEDNALKPLGKIIWRGPEAGGWQLYANGRSSNGSGTDGEPLPARFLAATSTDGGGFNYALNVDEKSAASVVEQPRKTSQGFEREIRITADRGDVPSLQLSVGMPQAGWRYEVEGATLAGPAKGEAGSAGATSLVVPAIGENQSHKVVLRYVRVGKGKK